MYAKMLTVYVNDFTYTVNNAEATITGFTNSTATEVVIPTYLNTFPVTAIGDGAFTDMTMIRTLYLSGDIEIIGDNAFYNCNSMSKIIMPDSITSIGSNAFYNCALLESITIPENVTFIGDNAFYNCAQLTEINYNASNVSDLSSDNQIFYNAGQNGDGITVNIGANVTNIPAYLFYNASLSENLSKIANIIFAENSVCESIGSYAFYNCSALKSVNLPEGLTSIGNRAFYNCNSLESINLPDDLTAISDYAFYNCNLLESAALGNSLTSIGDYAFCCCSSFISITIPNSVTSIGTNAFNCCTSLISVTIGKSVTSIGDMAFSTCPKLIEVYNLSALEITAGSWNNGCVALYAKYVFTETSSKTNIIYDGDYIFYNYNDIYYLMGYTGTSTAINLPDDIYGNNYSIYRNAFYYCTSLTSIIIPNGVTTIGSSAFSGCTSLKSVTIPDSVTSIGDSAFAGCFSLKSITIPDGVTSIGDSAFRYCTSLTSVTV